MKFIADVMLGKLAKRLRLLGFDVLYSSAFSDNEVIRLSLEQDRCILTRDRALAQRPLAANSVFVRSELVEEQLQQVIAEKGSPVPSSGPFTRCSRCNTRLQPLSRHQAGDLVPQHVLQHTQTFLHCTNCGRVYWRGSHVRNMKGWNRTAKKRPA